MPAAVLAAVVAVGLRAWHLGQSYELFIDEVFYSRIAESVATHGTLNFYNERFYLHPPLYFFEQAAVIRLFHVHGSIFTLVDALRATNLLFAAGSAVLVLRLVTRASSTGLGLLAAAIYALDPFILLFDSRVMLELPTVFWVLAGYALLLPLTVAPADGGTRRRLGSAAGAGACFGLALLTKETSALLYVLPLVWCVARGVLVRRRESGLALAVIVAVYLPYPVASFAVGDGSLYIGSKFGGFLRLVGLDQATGFNRPGSPSLLSRIVALRGLYLTTYLLIGLGLVFGLFLALRGTRPQRLLGLWALSSFAMLAYQVALGTIEEQNFYYIVVPAVVVTVVAAQRLVLRHRMQLRAGAALRYGVAGVLVVLVVGNGGSQWWRVHSQPDDGFRSAARWLDVHAPTGALVASLADTARWTLPYFRLTFDGTPQALEQENVNYVVTASSQVEQGYGEASPDLVSWLRLHAVQVHETDYPSQGRLTVWYLPMSSLPATAPPGDRPAGPGAAPGTPDNRGYTPLPSPETVPSPQLPPRG